MEGRPYAFQVARIRVPDLDASVRFYDYHVGLTVTGENDGTTYLRAGEEHHCLELSEDSGLDEAVVAGFGFGVDSPGELAAMRDRIQEQGVELLPLEGSVKPWVTDGFAIEDPNGMRLEFFLDLQVYAEVPFRLFRPVMMVHPFIGTPRYEETLRFYVETVGMRPSDYIADQTAFLRTENRLHHSFAIRRVDAFEVAHICFMMQNLDHVMRGRARAINAGVPIPSDMVNHSASESLAFYMHDTAHGPRIELCHGHRVLTPEEHEHTHRPRRMVVDPRDIDVWRVGPDDWGRF